MGRSSSGHGDDLPRDHDRGDPVPRARRSRLPSPRPVGAGGGTGLVGATQPARLAVGARRARRALPGLRVRQRAGGETASENLEFTPLLKDRVYEFLFVWSPLKIVG